MKIEELLAKKIVGILSDEEEQELQRWVDEHPSHEAYMQKLRQRRNYSELYRQYRDRYPQRAAVSRFAWKCWAARAAMWTLPVILAFSLWFGLRATGEESPEIVPGSSKAMLYLENGAVVQLGKMNVRKLPISKFYV